MFDEIIVVQGASYFRAVSSSESHGRSFSARLGYRRRSAPHDRADCGEELMAEIASAFLSAELGVTQDTRADHAQRA
jgi:antirestriction protein ArdC